MTELQAINLDDFTGGLNLWRNQFNIAPNESPGMLNMEIDPRGGFYTRKGWSRWNATDAVLLGVMSNPTAVKDSADLDLTGDMQITVRVALDDWVSGSTQVLVSKAPNPVLTGYSLQVSATGNLVLQVGDGGGAQTSTSTTPIPGVDGVTLWLRVNFDASDGGGNRVADFYYAADQATEPSSWTQLGTTVTSAPNVTVATNTENLWVGEDGSGGSPAAGDFYRVIIRNVTAGTTVLDLSPDVWEPRNSFIHQLADGSYLVYVANDGKIEASGANGVFGTLEVGALAPISCDASPHLADFAAWGDYLYIACGSGTATHRRDGSSTPTAAADAYGNYNDDYTTPDAIGSGYMPRCEFIETHSGYVFAGFTAEGGDKPNRIRWSHPSQPENWASLDFIDIEAGGGKITGLKSFQDHLLIFKDDSIWALYGYDSESWQLVRVSAAAGAPNITAVATSESTIYFYSSAERGTIFAYSGAGAPVDISKNLRTVLEESTNHTDVWLAWAGKRLWCSLPWTEGGSTTEESTAFVFDPMVGNGAWVAHRPALGYIKSIIEGGDLATGYPLAAICGCSGAACLAQLDYGDTPIDVILEDLTQSPVECYYVTGWQHAGWPERRKSWRRPRFIMSQADEAVQVDFDTYFDYDEAAPKRSHNILVPAEDAKFWRETGPLETGGFAWGDGTKWGEGGAQGSIIVRGVQASEELSGLGVNRAIQIKFTTNPEYLGKAWGINLITLKYSSRRFTT